MKPRIAAVILLWSAHAGADMLVAERGLHVRGEGGGMSVGGFGGGTLGYDLIGRITVEYTIGLGVDFRNAVQDSKSDGLQHGLALRSRVLGSSSGRHFAFVGAAYAQSVFRDEADCDTLGWCDSGGRSHFFVGEAGYEYRHPSGLMLLGGAGATYYMFPTLVGQTVVPAGFTATESVAFDPPVWRREGWSPSGRLGAGFVF